VDSPILVQLFGLVVLWINWAYKVMEVTESNCNNCKSLMLQVVCKNNTG
jgi:hypothetical protein